MTRKEQLDWLCRLRSDISYMDFSIDVNVSLERKRQYRQVLYEVIKALEQEPRKGQWLRMSDLSEQEDDRYMCSRCGNVVHYTNKMNLYTFNSWCGRCGSDNGRHIDYEEVKE